MERFLMLTYHETTTAICKHVSPFVDVSTLWMIVLFQGIIGEATSLLAFQFNLNSLQTRSAVSVVSLATTRTMSSFSFSTTTRTTTTTTSSTLQLTRRAGTTTISGGSSPSIVTDQSEKKHNRLSHADMVWKLKPPPTPTPLDDDDNYKKEEEKWKLGEFIISKPPDNTNDDDASFQLWLSTVRAAVALVSAGQNQIVLEAWIKQDKDHEDSNIFTTSDDKMSSSSSVSSSSSFSNNDNIEQRRLTKAGRFGITIQAGPFHPLIQSTVQDLFGSNSSRTAAIIYMFIEPAFRGHNLGSLALQVIAFLHGTVADCDYTLLVADDKSSSSSSSSANDDNIGQQHRLVAWYEREGGFVRAPALQELMGSPNQIHGISMIGPTNTRSTTTKSSLAQAQVEAVPDATTCSFLPLPQDCTIEWYYDPDIISSSR